MTLAELNQIVLHLGNGASASAIRGGVAVETSMGLTPLEGLVMGTRSGDIDPGVLHHLQRDARHVDRRDRRRCSTSDPGSRAWPGSTTSGSWTSGSRPATRGPQLAFDVYVPPARKYVGAYLAVLGRVDAIAFTAGVGENAANVRADTLSGWKASASRWTGSAIGRRSAAPG